MLYARDFPEKQHRTSPFRKRTRTFGIKKTAVSPESLLLEELTAVFYPKSVVRACMDFVFLKDRFCLAFNE